MAHKLQRASLNSQGAPTDTGLAERAEGGRADSFMRMLGAKYRQWAES